MTTNDAPYRPSARLMLTVAMLLALPLVAMQFTHNVAWGPADFAVAGALLLGAGVLFELLAKKARNNTYRIAAALAVGSALFLVWANLAVGLIGSENNAANLMYLGVIAVGLIGAFAARFQPAGMARTMFAMAAAQAVVAGIALAMRMDVPTQVLGVNAFFVGLFAVSGVLFQQASRAQVGQRSIA